MYIIYNRPIIIICNILCCYMPRGNNNQAVIFLEKLELMTRYMWWTVGRDPRRRDQKKRPKKFESRQRPGGWSEDKGQTPRGNLRTCSSLIPFYMFTYKILLQRDYVGKGKALSHHLWVVVLTWQPVVLPDQSTNSPKSSCVLVIITSMIAN